MKKSYIVLALGAILLLAACNGPLEDKKEEVAVQGENYNGGEIEEGSDSMEETTNETQTPDTTDKPESMEETVIADDVPADRYAAYTETTYNSLLGKKPFAIFFHATWCPTCIAMEKDILANLSDLPSGTVLLKADYDTEKELKAKYKITTQSTIVMINAKGEATETLAAPSFAKIKTAFTKIAQ